MGKLRENILHVHITHIIGDMVGGGRGGTNL